MTHWYLQHGLRLPVVCQLVEYEQRQLFSWFPEKVTNARRETNKDPWKKKLDHATKLKGNSFYGKMIGDLGHHKCTKFTRDERLLMTHLCLHFLII